MGVQGAKTPEKFSISDHFWPVQAILFEFTELDLVGKCTLDFVWWVHSHLLHLSLNTGLITELIVIFNNIIEADADMVTCGSYDN